MIITERELIEKTKEIKALNDELNAQEPSLDTLTRKSELLGQMQLIEWILDKNL